MIGDIMQGAAAITDSITNFNNMVYGIYNTERNFNYQKHLHEYQKQVQQKLWDREDTAVQRRAADLEAAGFNPLLAAGGAASTGAAVQGGFSNVSAPNFKSNASELVAGLLAMKKMQTDISMTRAQQELINEQGESQRLNNELIRKTIKWYEDHPGFAPGVESGFRTGKGLSSVFSEVMNNTFPEISDRLSNVSNRIAPFLGSGPQTAHPSFNRVMQYHIDNGVPVREAYRRAEKFMANYK